MLIKCYDEGTGELLGEFFLYEKKCEEIYGGDYRKENIFAQFKLDVALWLFAGDIPEEQYRKENPDEFDDLSGIDNFADPIGDVGTSISGEADRPPLNSNSDENLG